MSFKSWLRLLFLRKFQKKPVGLQLCVNPPYRNLFYLPCLWVFELSTWCLFKPPSGAGVGRCLEPSVCPLDQGCFICYDPGVRFLLRQNNPTSSCYTAPLSHGEHPPQSVWNTSALHAMRESSQHPQPAETQPRRRKGKR